MKKNVIEHSVANRRLGFTCKQPRVPARGGWKCSFNLPFEGEKS